MLRAQIRIAAIVVGTLVCGPVFMAAQDWTTLWRDPEVVNYELTMNKVRKVVDVMRAVASDPKGAAEIDNAYKELSKAKPQPTVADVSAVLERQPVSRTAISKTGLTAREYLLSSAAVSNAVLNMTLRRQSQSGTPPQSAAQKANVALLEMNQAEWKKLEQEMMQLASKSQGAKR